MAENVIIDFKVDYSQLDAAISTLEKTGQVDKKLAQDFKEANNQILEQGKIAKGSADKIGELVKVFNDVKGAATKMGAGVEKAFEQGVTDGLSQAGVSVEEFNDALKKATKSESELLEVANALAPTTDNLSTSTVELKKQLTETVKQLGKLKAAGLENTQQYQDLINKAAALKKSMADVNQEISVTASQTSKIDGLIGAATGLASGFAIAQGAIGLTGGASENLQKALLKVNSAMAILQGLQQVQNLLQKESAVSKLADATATGLQTAAQRIYTAVTGQATAATVAFKVALVASGIGAAVVLVLALAAAFSDTADSAEAANQEIERQKSLLEGLNRDIENRIALQLARAKQAGKAESELIRIRGRGIGAQIKGLEESNELLIAQRNALDGTTEAWFTLNKQIGENILTIGNLQNDAAVELINLNTQIAQEKKDADKKAKEDAEKAAADAKKRREQILQDNIDAIKKELIEVQKGGEDELKVRERLIIAEAALEIEQANKQAARINLINAQTVEAQKKLRADANIKRVEDERAALARVLAEIDKYTAEVNQKLNDQLLYEQSLLDARTGKTRRALQSIADDEKKTADERINALSSLERFELSRIDREIENVKKLLISQEEKKLKIEQLEDKREEIIEGTEKNITAITKTEEEKRAELRKKAFAAAVEVANGVADLFNSYNSLIASQEQQRLAEQKNQLDQLVEAGAITEKEAAKRQKQLEAQEKQIKTRQAQREKSLALFNAVINGASAVVAALARGGPVLAAITGALVAAQIGIIASRPLPKFGKGKKGNYEGLAEVGETGAELIQRGGRMYIAPRKTITYLGATDKVFTPKETKRMLHDVNTPVKSAQAVDTQSIDYSKLAKAMSGNQKGVSINISKDFVEESVGKALNKYYNNRYKF